MRSFSMQAGNFGCCYTFGGETCGALNNDTHVRGVVPHVARPYTASPLIFQRTLRQEDRIDTGLLKTCCWTEKFFILVL